MERLTRTQTLELIDGRLAEGLYERYAFINRWPFGQWAGSDLKEIPTPYLYWHCLNNERLTRFHLEYMRTRFEVCDWDFAPWQEQKDQYRCPEGHYDGSSSTQGYYNGYYDGVTK